MEIDIYVQYSLNRIFCLGLYMQAHQIAMSLHFMLILLFYVNIYNQSVRS